ncbi:protein kinase [Kitasatospora sp. NPDC048365]|uniref:protein kinase n=1 Tax=Kitasatospora sp. NPDC048365 TaxID=3364050 RepID=UPI003721E009
MRAVPGQVVGGRYRVTDRPAEVPAHPSAGVPARDAVGGALVTLSALELPEFLDPLRPEMEEQPGQGPRVAERVAAVAAAAPDHPRLLRGLGAVPEGGLLWVAEERLPGEPLSRLAGNGPVSPYRVAEIAADLAGALEALHRTGLTHGNLTAEAVVVCEDGAAVLGGLLRGAAEEELCQAVGGPVPRRVYEARALLVGARAERWPIDAGAPADCWALGVLLYRLLSGYGPYPEQDLPTLLGAVRDGRFRPADGCGVLRPLVERLLQPEAGLRPDAAAVRQELRTVLAGAPEPFGAGAVPAPLLPVLRPPAGPLVPRPRGARAVRRTDRQGAEHRAEVELRRPPRVPPALLGPLLVGGVVLALVAALAAVVAFAG